MHPSVGISDFKEKTKKDWETTIDLAICLSEAIAEHIKRPEIISMERFEIPGIIFDNSETVNEERGYLQEEREKLREYFESEDKDIREKVKGTLMSVWRKIISRSSTFTRLQNIGRRIYERMIQKLLPFDFAEEDTSIWSGEEKKKSIESKLAEHFEEKIKESMRNKIQARMEQRIS